MTTPNPTTMTPPQLLARARDMLAGADPSTAGLWPRCVAFLLRGALDAQVTAVLEGRRVGEPDRASVRVTPPQRSWNHRAVARTIASSPGLRSGV